MLGLGHHRELALRTLLRAPAAILMIEDRSSPYLRCADVSIGVSDVRDQAEVRRAVSNLADQRVDGVLTFSEPLLEVAAEVAAPLGLPHVSVEAATLSLNKDRMRSRLREAGAPSPRFQACGVESDALQAGRALGFPVVVKPSNRAGSIGVARASDFDQLSCAFRDAWRKRLLGNGTVVVEEFVPGPEVSVETVTWAGRTHLICVTGKAVTEDGHYVELEHALPIKPSGLLEIEAVVGLALEALGIENGVCHTELKLTPQGPYVIEVNARVAGDLIPDLIKIASGLNLYEAAIDIALNVEPRIRTEWHGGACIRFVATPPGRLRAVRGLETAEAMPGVREVGLLVQPGQRLNSIESSLDRRAFVVAAAEDAESARDAATAAAATIELDILIGTTAGA